MPLDQSIKKLRKEILEIAARHGVTSIRVFGSAARGEIGADSDVDFLVEAGEDTTPFFPGGLIADLEDILGRKVDVAEPDGLHWVIRDQVMKEAIAL